MVENVLSPMQLKEKENPFTGGRSADGAWNMNGQFQEASSIDGGGLRVGLQGNVSAAGTEQGNGAFNGNLQADVTREFDNGSALRVSPRVEATNKVKDNSALKFGQYSTDKVGKIEQKLGVGAELHSKQGVGATADISQNGDYQVGATYQSPQKPDEKSFNLGALYQDVGGAKSFSADAIASMKTDDLQQSLGFSLGTNGQETNVGTSASMGISQTYKTDNFGTLSPYANVSGRTSVGTGTDVSVFNQARQNLNASTDIGVALTTNRGSVTVGAEQQVVSRGDVANFKQGPKFHAAYNMSVF